MQQLMIKLLNFFIYNVKSPVVSRAFLLVNQLIIRLRTNFNKLITIYL
jgi:hypothetical protein